MAEDVLVHLGVPVHGLYLPAEQPIAASRLILSAPGNIHNVYTRALPDWTDLLVKWTPALRAAAVTELLQQLSDPQEDSAVLQTLRKLLGKGEGQSTPRTSSPVCVSGHTATTRTCATPSQLAHGKKVDDPLLRISAAIAALTTMLAPSAAAADTYEESHPASVICADGMGYLHVRANTVTGLQEHLTVAVSGNVAYTAPEPSPAAPFATVPFGTTQIQLSFRLKPSALQITDPFGEAAVASHTEEMREAADRAGTFTIEVDALGGAARPYSFYGTGNLYRHEWDPVVGVYDVHLESVDLPLPGRGSCSLEAGGHQQDTFMVGTAEDHLAYFEEPDGVPPKDPIRLTREGWGAVVSVTVLLVLSTAAYLYMVHRDRSRRRNT